MIKLIMSVSLIMRSKFYNLRPVKRNIVSITVYSDTDVQLSNISDSMKSVKGREDLLKTIVMLVGENDYDLKDTSEFPHWFIKFATVGKSNVKKLVSMGNKLYPIIDGKKVHFLD